MKTANQSVHCPECGYDVREQLRPTGARCPECGRFTTYRELTSRRRIERIVNPGSFFLSLTQLIFVPALVFWIAIKVEMAWSTLFLSGLILSALFNCGLAYAAVPRADRRNNPAAVIRLAFIYFGTNLLLFVALTTCLAGVLASIFSGLED